MNKPNPSLPALPEVAAPASGGSGLPVCPFCNKRKATELLYVSLPTIMLAVGFTNPPPTLICRKCGPVEIARLEAAQEEKAARIAELNARAQFPACLLRDQEAR